MGAAESALPRNAVNAASCAASCVVQVAAAQASHLVAAGRQRGAGGVDSDAPRERDIVEAIFEQVASDPVWRAALLHFIDSSCEAFTSDDENAHELAAIHARYVQLYEQMLTATLQRLRIGMDEFVAALQDGRQRGSMEAAMLWDMLDAMMSFLAFKQMMVARHYWLRRAKEHRHAQRAMPTRPGSAAALSEQGESAASPGGAEAAGAEVARVHLWGMGGKVAAVQQPPTLFAAELKELGPPAQPKEGPRAAAPPLAACPAAPDGAAAGQAGRATLERGGAQLAADCAQSGVASPSGGRRPHSPSLLEQGPVREPPLDEVQSQQPHEPDGVPAPLDSPLSRAARLLREPPRPQPAAGGGGGGDGGGDAHGFGAEASAQPAAPARAAQQGAPRDFGWLARLPPQPREDDDAAIVRAARPEQQRQPELPPLVRLADGVDPTEPLQPRRPSHDWLATAAAAARRLERCRADAAREPQRQAERAQEGEAEPERGDDSGAVDDGSSGEANGSGSAREGGLEARLGELLALRAAQERVRGEAVGAKGAHGEAGMDGEIDALLRETEGVLTRSFSMPRSLLDAGAPAIRSSRS